MFELSAVFQLDFEPNSEFANSILSENFGVRWEFVERSLREKFVDKKLISIN